jgi:hypothetical protein
MREGEIHVAMRTILKSWDWKLIAGEFPGGTDHELHPLNVVDPRLARDDSPDPRRHSLGELIPDIVAVKNDLLLIGEAKSKYSQSDQEKLDTLLNERLDDLLQSLSTFAIERGFPNLLPLERYTFCPVLIFNDISKSPPIESHQSYLRVISFNEGYFEGYLAEVGS